MSVENNSCDMYGSVKGTHCIAAAKLFKTLSNPLRLQIFCILFEKERSVSELEQFTTGSQSQISQFLKRMEYENLVKSRREGKFRIYSLADQKVRDLMEALSNIFIAQDS